MAGRGPLELGREMLVHPHVAGEVPSREFGEVERSGELRRAFERDPMFPSDEEIARRRAMLSRSRSKDSGLSQV